MSKAHQTGADVRSLTNTLISHARGAGGRLASAEVAQAVEAATATPAQAKRVLRALADAGVTVVVDGSASTRRRAVPARSATSASKATTAQTSKTAAAPPKPAARKSTAPKPATGAGKAKRPAPKKPAEPTPAGPGGADQAAADQAADPVAAAPPTATSPPDPAAVPAPSAPPAGNQPAVAVAADGATPGAAEPHPTGISLDEEEAAALAAVVDVVMDEPAGLAAKAKADAEADDDFEWDDDESDRKSVV